MSQRLVTDGTFWYLYDAEGNLTEKRVTSQAETLVGRYTWDHRNRLTKVEIFQQTDEEHWLLPEHVGQAIA